MPSVHLLGVGKHHVTQQFRQAHACGLGELAHLGGEGAADRDGEHIRV